MRSLCFTTGLLAFLFCTIAVASAQDIPSYKVTGQDITTFSVVVPINTTDKQITNLIYKFREARRQKNIKAVIPQWDNKGTDPTFWVFIFTKPEWATSERLQKFIMTSLKSPSDMAFSREFALHIIGEYFYSSLEEYGSIGFKDGQDRSIKRYKKLF